jgi:hypothetical protein
MRLQTSQRFSSSTISARTAMTTEFTHAERGMTRFPPNVEQITVEHESTRTWLVTRRNDVELRFPLNDADCRHLASLLMPPPV